MTMKSLRMCRTTTMIVSASITQQNSTEFNLLKEKDISVTPEEIEAEYEKIAVGAGVSVEEVKKHYEDPRAKEYLEDDAKEQKLYTMLFDQVKMSKGDKTTFAELFKPAN